uniref:Uncharacterized protein n=1 Tax=Mustela putorius furo TaxID=9669 RepID=M3XSL9_MUSPF
MTRFLWIFLSWPPRPRGPPPRPEPVGLFSVPRARRETAPCAGEAAAAQTVLPRFIRTTLPGPLYSLRSTFEGGSSHRPPRRPEVPTVWTHPGRCGTSRLSCRGAGRWPRR